MHVVLDTSTRVFAARRRDRAIKRAEAAQFAHRATTVRDVCLGERTLQYGYLEYLGVTRFPPRVACDELKFGVGKAGVGIGVGIGQLRIGASGWGIGGNSGLRIVRRGWVTLPETLTSISVPFACPQNQPLPPCGWQASRQCLPHQRAPFLRRPAYTTADQNRLKTDGTYTDTCDRRRRRKMRCVRRTPHV